MVRIYARTGPRSAVSMGPVGWLVALFFLAPVLIVLATGWLVLQIVLGIARLVDQHRAYKARKAAWDAWVAR